MASLLTNFQCILSVLKNVCVLGSTLKNWKVNNQLVAR